MVTTGRLGHYVQLDLFTTTHRVTGRAVVGAGGIHGELGNTMTDFLELTEPYISQIQRPGEIVASYKEGSFIKENILFIVLADLKDGIPTGTSHLSSVYLQGRPMKIFLTVPSFEIHGEIRLRGTLSTGSIIAQTEGNFLLVFNARASASQYADIFYEGGLVLVRKDRISMLCLDTEGDS